MTYVDKIEKLLDKLDAHDCQLGPESGCQCILIKEELQKMGYIIIHTETLEDHVHSEISQEVQNAIDRGEPF